VAIKGVRFGHVAFKVTDVERSIRWYDEALGAKLIYRVEAGGGRPELMFLEFSSGQCVELFSGGKNMLPSPPDAIGYVHFCLVIENLEQALDHLANGELRLGGEQTGARGHEEAASGRHGSILPRPVAYTRVKMGQLSVPVLSANDSCSMFRVRRMLR